MTEQQVQVSQPATKMADSFFAQQDADSATEANLEYTLQFAQNMISLKDSRPDEVKDYMALAMEKARNFLPKYYKSVLKYDKHIFNDMDSFLFHYGHDIDINSAILMFSNIRERIILCLAEQIGYRRLMKPSGDWQKKLMINQQVKETVKLHNIMYDNELTKMQKFAKFINISIFDNKYDQKIIITGVPGNGKSSTGITLAKLIAEDRGQTFNLENRTGIYYTDTIDLRKRLFNTRNQIIILDEGIFTLANLDTLKRESKEMVSVLTGCRNRGHVIIIIFTKLQRATKAVLELGTCWIHKPHRESGLLNVKQKLYPTEDPWGTKILDKASTNMQISTALVSHQNFICEMSTPKLPDEIDRKYEDLKLAAQAELVEAESETEAKGRTKTHMLNDLLTDFQDGKFTLATLEKYLKDTRNMASKKKRDSIKRMFIDKLDDEGILETIGADGSA